MNKTLNINLAGYIFHIDEDAFKRLENYLNTLKSQFINTEGGREIISDIEMRIAELFKERINEQKEVINLADVEQVVEIMGQPEDYLDLDEDAPRSGPGVEFTSRKKRIYRDTDNRIIGGVAAGLAAYFNIDTIWMRVIFLFLLFFSGFGILLYFIMWLIIPKAQTTAEKLQMRGEKVNISNIEKAIRDEMRGINENVKGFGSTVSSYDYKKPQNHLSSFFSDLGNFLADAFRLIFKVIGKLFGLLFLFLGFMVLIALAVGLFAGGVEIMGSGYGFSDLFDFFELVTVSEGHYNLLLAGIILSVIAPFFLLVYLGMRLLFSLEPLNRPSRNALVFTTFLGLVFILIAGVKIGLQFDDQSRVSTELPLTNAKNYTITLKQDSITSRYMSSYAPNWIHEGEFNAFDEVGLDIRKSESDQAYLKVTVTAQGPNRREARINAREIRYDVEIKDSTILIPYYYSLGKGLKFRDQYVNVMLYLPEGYSVYIDENIVELLDDVENLQDTWDLDMGDTKWIMLDKGLSCEGCSIPEGWEGTDHEYKYEDTDNSLEIKIDDNGVKFKIEDKKNQQKTDSVEMTISSCNKSEADNSGHSGLLPFKNELQAII